MMGRISRTVLLLAFAIAACAETDEQPAASADTASAMTTTTTREAPTAPAGLLDPNSASEADLRRVPGLNDTVISALIQGRPYQDMRAVDRVLAGLSEAERDTVYTYVWRPIDLNTATGAEIELIPGVGPRMRHEFEEYRPYTSIEQFRREIGKYVDDDEVARLERYVRIGSSQ